MYLLIVLFIIQTFHNGFVQTKVIKCFNTFEVSYVQSVNFEIRITSINFMYDLNHGLKIPT